MNKEHLTEFIEVFIQPGTGLRKGKKNHISYIYKTLNRIFQQYYAKKGKFTPEEILDAFYVAGFTTKEEPEGLAGFEGVIFHPAWVKLQVSDIQDLYLTTIKLPQHTAKNNVDRVEHLKKRIISFGNRLKGQ